MLAGSHLMIRPVRSAQIRISHKPKQFMRTHPDSTHTTPLSESSSTQHNPSIIPISSSTLSTGSNSRKTISPVRRTIQAHQHKAELIESAEPLAYLSTQRIGNGTILFRNLFPCQRVSLRTSQILKVRTVVLASYHLLYLLDLEKGRGE